MATSTITGPDGQKYTVTHPDSASDEQIMAYVRQNVESGDLQADAPREALESAAAPVTAVSDYLIDTASNVIPSLGNQVQGLAEVVANPMEALSNLGSMAMGGMERAGRNINEMYNTGMNILDMGPSRPQQLPPGPNEEAFQGLIDFYKGRYGSPEAALETVRTDPAGVALDVSGVAAPFSPRMANLSPPVAAARGTARGTGRLMREGAETVMESALKPSTTIPTLEREALVRTALEYGINPTQRGIQKLNNTIKSLSADVGRLIDEANQAGGTLPVDYVFRNLSELRKQKGGPLIDAGTDLAIIDEMEAALRDSAKRTGKDVFDARDLQDIKLDLDQKIDWVKRDKPKKNTRMQVRKAIRAAAREGVEELAPGVGPKNAELSQLYGLQKPLERAESRISNRDIFGMGDALSLGTGGAVGLATGNPMLGLGVMATQELLTNPRISPRVAQGMKGLGRLAEGVDAGIARTSRVTPPMLMMLEAQNEVFEDPIYEEGM